MKFRIIFLGLAFFVVAGEQYARAQATLATSSQPTAITRQGHTELVGNVQIRVTIEKTVAGTLLVSYSPFVITNSFATGITVTGTGDLLGVSATLDVAQNGLILGIPPGGRLGDTVLIEGVRVSAVDSTAKTATAKFSSPGSGGNTIVPGEETRTVVFDVLPGIGVAPASDRTVVTEAGLVTDRDATVIIREGYVSGFQGPLAFGMFGQTVRTQIAVIPYPSIPEGAVLTFPGQLVSDNTYAGLRTLSGAPETLRKTSPQQFMIYEFFPDETNGDGNPLSRFAIETFTVPIVLTLDAPGVTGKIHFWVALHPFGAAVPSSAFPSTQIPRYAKVVVPQDTDEDGLADDVDTDADDDGLTNDEEQTLGTDILKKDTDGDKLTDFEEVRGTRGFKTDPLKTDTDGGGINDFEEIELGADPTKAEFNLYYPYSVSSTGRYTGITLANPLGKGFTVELTAYDPSGRVITGADMTNPVKISLPPFGQVAKLTTEVFGPGFVFATFGSIIARTPSDLMAGFFMAGDADGNRLDGATASFLTQKSFVLPAIARGRSSSFTEVQIFNPTGNTASVKLTLVDRNGAVISSKTFSLNAMATLTGNVAALFDVAPGSLNAGYIRGVSDVGVVGFELFGDGDGFNGLNGQEIIDARKELLVPFYVSGGGWVTELELENLDAGSTVLITIRLLDRNGAGAPISTNPQNVRITAGSIYTTSLDLLFGPIAEAFRTGQLRLEISSENPFVRIPAIGGSVRFGTTDARVSAAFPLASTQGTDVIYSHIVQGGNFYTGITIANPNVSAAAVTVEFYLQGGQLAGSATFILNGGQSINRLLNELIPSIVSQRGGWFRVKSDKPVLSFALFGSDDGRLLSVIGPQKAK